MKPMTNLPGWFSIPGFNADDVVDWNIKVQDTKDYIGCTISTIITNHMEEEEDDLCDAYTYADADEKRNILNKMRAKLEEEGGREMLPMECFFIRCILERHPVLRTIRKRAADKRRAADQK